MTDEKVIQYVRTKLTLKPGATFSRNHPKVRELFAAMKERGFKFQDETQDGLVVTLRFAPIYPTTDAEVELKSIHKIFKK